jgi:uncharacterized membrane protein YcaP (DUF421 family)
METVLRVTFVYVFVWACFRVVGKRELTRMTPFELVVILFVPQLFSRALTRQDYSLTNGVIGATTLFVLMFLSSIMNHRWSFFRRVMQARPTVLLQQGVFIEAHLNKERIAPADVVSAMHKAGLTHLSEVEWAILESDGSIAIIPARSVK